MYAKTREEFSKLQKIRETREREERIFSKSEIFFQQSMLIHSYETSKN